MRLDLANYCSWNELLSNSNALRVMCVTYSKWSFLWRQQSGFLYIGPKLQLAKLLNKQQSKVWLVLNFVISAEPSRTCICKIDNKIKQNNGKLYCSQRIHNEQLVISLSLPMLPKQITAYFATRTRSPACGNIISRVCRSVHKVRGIIIPWCNAFYYIMG